jgi:hypothetical protein
MIELKLSEIRKVLPNSTAVIGKSPLSKPSLTLAMGEFLADMFWKKN